MKFGTRLRLLRNEQNLTLRDLEKETGISYSALGKYERDERQPDFSTLEKLAEYFNVSIDWLLGQTSNRDRSNKIENDISKRLEQFKADLILNDGLSFNGEPMTDDEIETLLEAMEFVTRMIEKRNKTNHKNEEL